MENIEKSDITWMELKSLIDEKQYIESCFQNVYPCSTEDSEIIFMLPNGEKMHVDTISDWGCLVMEYTDPGKEVFGEDGDLFYKEDYKTPYAMFQDMLKETED